MTNKGIHKPKMAGEKILLHTVAGLLLHLQFIYSNSNFRFQKKKNWSIFFNQRVQYCSWDMSIEDK